MDLDGTIAWDVPAQPYAEGRRDPAAVAPMRVDPNLAFMVVVHPSSNVRFRGVPVGGINTLILAVVVDRPRRHDGPAVAATWRSGRLSSYR